MTIQILKKHIGILLYIKILIIQIFFNPKCLHKKFLEIKTENNKVRCKNSIEYEPLKK